MRIVVFDTETTSLEKPFCYNIGYVIYDTELQAVLEKRDFVVEQIWHNRELFSTAYYADKRQIYIKDMRAKKVHLEKIGYITQMMIRDFANYEVVSAYAYNSPFDDKVFDFNSEWFKIKNPLDNIPIYDIRGYVFDKIGFTPKYKEFCENNELFTEKGNYSTTAENIYRFIKNDLEFAESHTALADSEIELEILLYCIKQGAEWDKEYKCYRSIPRKAKKVLDVKDQDGEHYFYDYEKITVYKEKENCTKIYLR